MSLEVSESALDFLLLEIVDAFCKSSLNSAGEADKESAYAKLEALGYRVGVALVESFRWFSRLSSSEGMAETCRLAFPYPAFPCGLIRGALSNLGVPSVVMAEISSIPQ
ncbi:hypothetical protein HK096_004691, partial [Nowakowskiella sp. JEL0078]